MNEKELKYGKKQLKLTNLDKVFFPGSGITKGDVFEYYKEISDIIMPYLKNVPQSLHRHPDGIKSKGFYHKNIGDTPPDWVSTAKLKAKTKKKEIKYLVPESKMDFYYMIQLGCIEINPFTNKVNRQNHPQYAVLDIDREDISFANAVKTAKTIVNLLNKADASAYCKTSGKSGLHIFIPLNGKYSYQRAKSFAKTIAECTHKKLPDITSLERLPEKRKEKIYIDYLQNAAGQTLAAPYSLRPVKGATVSAPITHRELTNDLNPADFTMDRIKRRIKNGGDIFKPVLGKGIDLDKTEKMIIDKQC